MEMVSANICRTCLTKQQSEMQPIFKVIDILQKGAAVHVSHYTRKWWKRRISKNDNLPKNICDTCYKRATNAYAFYCQCERSEEILKRTFSDISEYNVFISSNEPDIRSINYSNNNYNCLYSNQCESEFEGVDSIKTINLSSDESNNTTDDHQLEFMPNKNLTTQYNDACLMESSCKWNNTVQFHNDQRLNSDLNLVYSQNQNSEHLFEKPTIENINNPCNNINNVNENSNSSLVDLLTVDSCTDEQNCNANQTEVYEDESVKCKTCDMKFTTKWRLKTHMRTHKNKAHLCQTCGKKFSFHSNLVRHVRIHNGDLPYVCPHCPEKRFAQSNQLKSHLLTHSKSKEHLCNICGVGYARVHALNVHIRRKHSQTALKRIYSCTICSKNYKDISDLSQHMLIHRNARSYICDLCGKAFNRKNNLKVHELIHRGEKPFQCLLCSKSFRQKHVLESHMNTHKEDNTY